jgi:hypothetical protein
MRAYRTLTNNPCPHINAEILLAFILDYTMRIHLCRLVLVVNVNAVSTEKLLSYKLYMNHQNS